MFLYAVTKRAWVILGRARLAGVLLLIPAWSAVLRAQSSVTGPDATLATITTDTGAFAPGHRDFSRYDSPKLCRAATALTRHILQRDLTWQAFLDTVSDPALHDTLGGAQLAGVIHSCTQHVGTSATMTDARLTGFDLLFAAGEDSVVYAVVAKQLAAATTPAALDAITLQAVQSYLTVQPARIGAAEALVARLDSAGPAHVIARQQAHYALMQFWHTNRDAARYTPEAEQVIALGNTMTDAQYVSTEILPQHQFPPYDAFEQLLAAKSYTDSAAVLPLLKRMQHDYWGRLARLKSYADAKVIKYATMTDSALLRERVQRVDGGTGRTLSLWVDYWCPVGQKRCVARGDTLPNSGHVTLYLGLAPIQNYYLWHPWIELKSTATAEYVQRVLARYEGAGLVVTIVVPTRGGTSLDGAVPPAQEAERARWFVQDYLHLPVNVLVQQNHYRTRPAPDGRRIWVDTAQYEQLSVSAWPDVGGYIEVVGREGKTLSRGQRLFSDQVDNFSPEAAVNLVLQRALAPVTASRAPLQPSAISK